MLVRLCKVRECISEVCIEILNPLILAMQNEPGPIIHHVLKTKSASFECTSLYWSTGRLRLSDLGLLPDSERTLSDAKLRRRKMGHAACKPSGKCKRILRNRTRRSAVSSQAWADSIVGQHRLPSLHTTCMMVSFGTTGPLHHAIT